MKTALVILLIVFIMLFIKEKLNNKEWGEERIASKSIVAAAKQFLSAYSECLPLKKRVHTLVTPY